MLRGRHSNAFPYSISVGMRNIKYILFTFVSLSILFACGNKGKKLQSADELLKPSTMDYTKQDTSEINYLVNTYVSYFGKGDLDGCANLLYKFHNGGVQPLTPDERSDFKKAFSVFHFYGSKVQRMILRSDRNNQVDITLQIMKDGSIEDNKGVTTLSLNPVVVNGKWYLTLLDKDAEGVVDVYQQEAENANQ